MRTGRLIGMTGVALALLVSLSAVVGEGVGSAAPPPSATGSVACKITGTGNFSPKLTFAGVSTTAVKFKFNAASPTSGGCGGAAGIPNSAGSLTPVTITAVTVRAIGYLTGPANANSCSVFSSTDTIGVIKVKYIWAAAPPIAPTIVTYTGGTSAIVSGAITDTISLPAVGTVLTGSGSFNPPTAAPISLLTNIVSPPCLSGGGPYPNFTINVGSTIALP